MITKIQRLAYRKIRKVIISGLLKPKQCNCNSKKQTIAHHEDYNNPLDVDFMCRRCHANIHNIHIQSPEIYESKEERTKIIENAWEESIHIIGNESYIKGRLKTTIA